MKAREVTIDFTSGSMTWSHEAKDHPWHSGSALFREVLPDTVTITRAELRDAWERATEWIEDDEKCSQGLTMINEMVEELFASTITSPGGES